MPGYEVGAERWRRRRRRRRREREKRIRNPLTID